MPSSQIKIEEDQKGS